MNLAEVRALLPIDRNRLDDHLMINASIMEQIEREVVKREMTAHDCKRQLETTEARVIAELKGDDAKLSNPIAEKEAKRDDRWVSAWERYSEAKLEQGEWEAAKSAWRQRGYDLKALADLYGAQYFTITSIHAPGGPDRDIRSALRTAHQEVNDKRSRRRSIVNP